MTMETSAENQGAFRRGGCLGLNEVLTFHEDDVQTGSFDM